MKETFKIGTAGYQVVVEDQMGGGYSVRVQRPDGGFEPNGQGVAYDQKGILAVALKYGKINDSSFWGKFKNNGGNMKTENAFTNGQLKAQQEIANKHPQFENANNRVMVRANGWTLEQESDGEYGIFQGVTRKATCKTFEEAKTKFAQLKSGI